MTVYERLDALIRNGLSGGEDTALISGETVWTRAQLSDEIARRAAALREKGCEPGDIVGVCLPRCADLVASLCAVHTAGGVYLPLDPGYPRARLDYMREQSGARFEIGEAGIHALPNGRQWGHTEHLAYLIYTSGSTGTPKGVAVTHANVINFLRSMMERPGIKAGDRLLAVTTPSFDISVLEIFSPLAAGGTLVMAEEEDIRDGARLAALIEAHDISVMQATPSGWRLLLEAGWQGKEDLRALCGGEPLSSSLAEMLLSRTAEVWNMYGPTETTVWSSCARINDAADIHLGTPIAATDILILNDKGEAVPDGETGEVAIGGAGVAEGYWQRPDLTAEKFIPDEHGNRFYRTGDSGFFDEQGQLRFRGRLDRQIKLRGHRIEPEEIERVLAGLSGIEEVAVTVEMEEGAPSALVAHIVSIEDTPQLMMQAAEKLPIYMMPARMERHESLPHLPNGKIDRAQLSMAPKMQAAPEAGAGLSPMEELIAGVFADILKCSVPGPSVNFFELGGHSLLAARALAQLRSRTGIAIPLRLIFEAESITALALEIEALTPAEEFEF